jgi:hypothetical protein
MTIRDEYLNTKIIFAYQQGVEAERQRITNEVLQLEERSHKTRTPIYQDTFFDKMKQVLYIDYLPKRFKDASNGE